MTAFQPLLRFSVLLVASGSSVASSSGFVSGTAFGGGGIVVDNRVAGGGRAGCGGCDVGAGTADELVVDVGGIVPHGFAVDPTGAGKIIFGRL